MKITRILMFLLFFFSLSRGAVYYVSPSGSNYNNGSKENPWKTIQHAANLIHAGDTVYIKGGTYREDIVFRTSGESGLPIYISAEGEEEVIIKGAIEFARGISYP